jgi:Family of unknown function (DUF6399)
MEPVSTAIAENATKKRHKVHRNRPEIARKVIAFQEIINLTQNKKSFREAANFLEVPNATMQSWRKRVTTQELEEFFATPIGAAFLQRNVMAVMKLMKCGPCGIRGVQEFLRNSGLSQFVASSEGALHNFWRRCEECIVEFGKAEEKRLASGMKHKKITAGLDEMFRGGRPCLVAIEVVSNYILIEKFTENRTAETWNKEMKGRLEGLNITIEQVVSDLCGAIRACTKEFKAVHIPELFHAQYEISKATSASLASQARAVEKALNEISEKGQRLFQKPRKLIREERRQQELEIEAAIKHKEELKSECEIKSKRREVVRSAIGEMGKIHHPIDLQTGEVQTAEKIKNRFDEQFRVIKQEAKAAKLGQSSLDRLEKAERAFGWIVSYLKYFFIFYMTFVSDLQLTFDQKRFFDEVVFPLSYLRMIWKRLPKKLRIEVASVFKDLEAKIREGPWLEGLKDEWMKQGKSLAEMFQRSSSCVEGRNGVLSLNHHRFHRLNERSLKVLTIVHNYDVRRSDGTTAAERFFEAKHGSLFESLVLKVAIPGRPQRQHHDRGEKMAA